MTLARPTTSAPNTMSLAPATNFFRQSAGAVAAGDAAGETRDEEGRGDLVHVPAELEHADHDGDKAGSQSQQHQHMAGGELGQLGQIQRLMRFRFFQIGYDGQFRMFLYLLRIAHDVPGGYDDHDGQDEEAEGDAGEDRQFRQALSYAYRKGIESAAGKAAGCAEQDHGRANDGIVAQSPCQHNAQRYKDDRFLRHADGKAEYSEDADDDWYEDDTCVSECNSHTADAGFQRAGGDDDVECTRDDEHKEDDVRYRLHAQGDVLEQVERFYRVRFHILEGVGIDNGTSGHLIFHSLIGACRYDIGQDSHDEDDDADDDVGVRYFKPLLFDFVWHEFLLWL